MQKFSRTDLLNYKAEMIRKKASEFVRHYYGHILMNAQYGKTSYFVNYNNSPDKNRLVGIPAGQQGPPPEPTMEDILVAFREQFPDCSVEYVENWIDQPAQYNGQQTRVLMKGIQIDWS